MKILLYWVDAHRTSDYNLMNPYHDFLFNRNASGKFNRTQFTNFITEYPSTYRFLLSFMNGTSNIENGEYDFLRNPKTEYLHMQNYLLKLKLQLMNYKFRSAETVIPDFFTDKEFVHGRNSGEMGMLNKCFSEVINTIDPPENVVDLVYDLGFHEYIMNDERITNTIESRTKAYEDSFKLSEDYLNKELWEKYDCIIYFGDHGYSDVIDGKFVQHDYDLSGNKNTVGLGSPVHHSNPVLSVFTKNETNVIECKINDKLVTQVDLHNFIINLAGANNLDVNLPINRQFVVTHGYWSEDKSYPDIYHLVFTDKSFVSVSIQDLLYKGFEHCKLTYKDDFGNWCEQQHALSEFEYEILYQESPYFNRIMNSKEYSNYKFKY